MSITTVTCKIAKKIFYMLIIAALITVQYIIFYTCSRYVSYISEAVNSHEQKLLEYSKNATIVLLWNNNLKRLTKDFPYMNCPVSDCIFLADRRILPVKVDAILFNENIFTSPDRPTTRNLSQVFIFTSVEPPQKAPACDMYTDDLFNWTFTYRLDSTVKRTFFVVRNTDGETVAPDKNITWRQSSSSPAASILNCLRNKRRAIAWIPTHCEATTKQNEYMASFQEQLYHFSLRVDIYGPCSKKRCPGGDCASMIREYYFFIAFEDYFAPDYVTEGIVDAYANHAVPIVLGGANYSWFLPPHSYLDANVLHPYNLAHTVQNIIKQPKVYEDYFKWTNIYSVELDFGINNPLCELCSALKTHNVTPKVSEVKTFRLWWNGGPSGMKWCLPKEFWNETEKVHGWTGRELIVNTTLFS